MTATATTIKTKLQARLATLVPASLGEVQVDDLKLPLFDREFAAFPAAIITTPAIDAVYETQADNLRTHTFGITVLMRQDDIASASDVETLMETLLDLFDTDYTLSGTATGGVEAATSVPEAITDRSKSYIAFTVLVKVKALKQVI